MYNYFLFIICTGKRCDCQIESKKIYEEENSECICWCQGSRRGANIVNGLWIILIGSLVAIAYSIVGCFLVLRKMSMIGDTMLSFQVSLSLFYLLNRVILFLCLRGLIIFGLLTVYLISLFQNSRVQDDASIGGVFTARSDISMFIY